jgi:hypothetical protein
VTDTRQESFARRRVTAVVVTVVSLAALIVLAQGLVSPSHGENAVHGRGAARTRGAASSHVSRGAAGRLPGGELRAGSDPSVLPGPVLIADRDNNRLLEVSPTGQVLWRFPEAVDLAPGQSFKLPDDAFFSPDGSQVVVTQEDDFVISIVDVTQPRIAYRYGHPGEPGAEPGYLHNPDDAMLTPGGAILSADIKNCRIVVIRPPAHRVTHQLGETGNCTHELGVSYGSPNGAFPMGNGDTVVTEIDGDWIDVLKPDGSPVTDTHPPGFSYPSDTNEVRPGVFLSVDYTNPGTIETFTASGRLLWRYEPTGVDALDQPSLALPLPNGDVLANDDKNERVIVIDPHTNKIVWQYGHTHESGTGPGYLANPDGVDLAPPYSLTMRFAHSLRAP